MVKSGWCKSCLLKAGQWKSWMMWKTAIVSVERWLVRIARSCLMSKCVQPRWCKDPVVLKKQLLNQRQVGRGARSKCMTATSRKTRTWHHCRYYGRLAIRHLQWQFWRALDSVELASQSGEGDRRTLPCKSDVKQDGMSLQIRAMKLRRDRSIFLQCRSWCCTEYLEMTEKMLGSL